MSALPMFCKLFHELISSAIKEFIFFYHCKLFIVNSINRSLSSRIPIDACRKKLQAYIQTKEPTLPSAPGNAFGQGRNTIDSTDLCRAIQKLLFVVRQRNCLYLCRTPYLQPSYHSGLRWMHYNATTARGWLAVLQSREWNDTNGFTFPFCRKSLE